MLTEALAQYERALCPDCKQPGWLAFDFDTNGWYEVKADCVCQACAAREQWAEEHKDMEPGQKISVMLDPGFEPKR